MSERIPAIRRFRLGIIAFIGALVLLVGIVGASTYVHETTTRQNCEAINSDRAVLRVILRRFEHQADPDTLPSFTRSLHDLAPAPC